MYGNYGFWSWYRYWHVDTLNQITLMLIDKPYYDYDYEYVPPKKDKVEVKKAREKFRGFFSHTKFQDMKVETSKEDTKMETEIEIAERLQREAQRQLAKRGTKIK